MILYVVSVSLAVIALILASQYLTRRAGASGRQLALSLLAAAIIGGILFLTFTGRLHWMAAAAVAVVPLLRRLARLIRYLPLMGRMAQRARGWSSGASPGGATPHRSDVQTRYLDMSLNHGTGEMEGRVTAGRFEGDELSSLSLDQLRLLWHEFQSHDAESARLLETYLDREHGDDWRGETPSTGSTSMSREEALSVLGLEDPKPTPEAIVQAHRRLMQKLHPDRGGSHYLAAKLNEAKDLLMQ
ncbi:MAG: molecular chaperone DnaJ [Pseudomonadales bacterium]